MKTFLLRQTLCLIQGQAGLENEWLLDVTADEAREARLAMNGKAVWEGVLQ